MEDSTEELTPILVPFEKAAPADPTDSSVTEKPKDPSVTTEPTAPPKKKEKSGSNIYDATSNLVGAVANAPARLMDNARRMVNGIINPGMLGENAGNAALDNLESDAGEHGLNNVAEGAERDLHAAQEQLANKKAAKANPKPYQPQFEAAYMSALRSAGITDPRDKNNGAKLLKFHDDLYNNINTLAENLKRNGVDPKVIADISKDYLHWGEFAYNLYNNQQVEEPRAAQNVTTANNDLTEAQRTRVVTEETLKNASLKKNFIESFLNNPQNKGLQLILSLASDKTHLLDSGDVLPDSYFLITDQFGNNIGSTNFDAKSAHLDLTAPELADMEKKLGAILTSTKDPKTREDAYRAYSYLSSLKTQQDLAPQNAAQEGERAGVAAYADGTPAPKNFGFHPDIENWIRSQGGEPEEFAHDLNMFGVNLLIDDGILDQSNATDFLNSGGVMTHDASDANMAILKKAWGSFQDRLAKVDWDGLSSRLNSGKITADDIKALKTLVLHRSMSARLTTLGLKKDATTFSEAIEREYNPETGLRIRGPTGEDASVIIPDIFGTIRRDVDAFADQALDSLDRELTTSLFALTAKGAAFLGYDNATNTPKIMPVAIKDPTTGTAILNPQILNIYAQMIDNGENESDLSFTNRGAFDYVLPDDPTDPHALESAFALIRKGQSLMGQAGISGQQGYSVDAPELIYSPEMELARILRKTMDLNTGEMIQAFYRAIGSSSMDNAFAWIEQSGTAYGALPEFFREFRAGEYAKIGGNADMYSKKNVEKIHDTMAELDNAIEKAPDVNTQRELIRYKYGFMGNYAQAIKEDMARNVGISNRTHGILEKEWWEFRNKNVTDRKKRVPMDQARAEVQALLNGSDMTQSGLIFTSAALNTPSMKARIGNILDNYIQNPSKFGTGQDLIHETLDPSNPDGANKTIAENLIFANMLFNAYQRAKR